MTHRPQEATDVHARLLKCTLEVDNARAYWAHVDASTRATKHQAFEHYWFGARSLNRVDELLANMRLRYDAYPAALHALHRWPHMAPETRTAICHWHLQLADPLYRRFTGSYLVARRASARAEITRDLVIQWVANHGPDRWSVATRIKFGSKLLTAAYAASLVSTNRDPRPLSLPRITDEALEYLMYLLRETSFEGSLLDNPYTTSVGLDGGILEDRLRNLPGLAFTRQGDLVEFGWRHENLRAWTDANLTPQRTSAPRLAGGAL